MSAARLQNPCHVAWSQIVPDSSTIEKSSDWPSKMSAVPVRVVKEVVFVVVRCQMLLQKRDYVAPYSVGHPSFR